MKKLLVIAFAIVSVIFMAAVILGPVAAQKSSGGGKPIPENVVKIASKSCVNCHAEPGNPMAIEHVNLTIWEKYSAEKQAKKAQKMCDMVTMGKMPPKSFREKHPEGVPNKEEIKTICDWAASLQVAKK